MAILGFVAAGSLRLSLAATKTLKAVQVESVLLDRVQALEVGLLTHTVSDSGEDNGLRWETRDQSLSLMGGLWRLTFRRLEASLDGRVITLYIP